MITFIIDLLLVFAIKFKAFVPFFFFSANDSSYKIWKILFISFKCVFRSQDSQIFVFPSCPLFSFVSHCLTRWLKINSSLWRQQKLPAASLNNNIKIHIVWYLEKQTSSDIETWSTDRVLRNISMEKVCRKCESKVNPRPLFNYGRKPKTTNCKKLFWNNIFGKRIIKNHNKVNLFFSLASSLFLLTRLWKRKGAWN